MIQMIILIRIHFHSRQYFTLSFHLVTKLIVFYIFLKMDVIKFGDHQQQQQQQLQLQLQPGDNVKTANHWEPGESNQLQQHQQVEHATLKHQESTSCLNTPSAIQPVPPASPFIGLSKFGVITSDKTHHRLVNDNSYSLSQSYEAIILENQINFNHRRQNALFTSPPDTFTKDCNRHLPSVLNSNSLDSANFIRRRNERERARVKNVNEGFDRLRKHLPLSPSQREKRLSKVETLKMAISYIRHLETVLKSNDPKEERSI
ncbi:uncharacterized protein LOC107362150 [Tetranychus urticae]|uniref:BHLH domain-containing protein n=1 Tax=Tetranychus urticae TaxID=32264 RepID=T1K984_TETUR|nr:uncharacterized protein LOC107362150 [Tetranychus urticae]